MVSFVHSTQAQNLAALRELLRGLTGLRAARACRWMLANLSDAQLRTLFAVTVGQIPNLKARLQAKADALTAAESVEGEA